MPSVLLVESGNWLRRLVRCGSGTHLQDRTRDHLTPQDGGLRVIAAQSVSAVRAFSVSRAICSVSAIQCGPQVVPGTPAAAIACSPVYLPSAESGNDRLVVNLVTIIPHPATSRCPEIALNAATGVTRVRWRT